MITRDAWTIDTRLEQTLEALNLGGLDRSRPLASLSPGQRARLRLALTLVDRPEALVLDEPTNHLDTDGREHLAHTIDDWQGPVLMTSHDRAFIERTATGMASWSVEVDPMNPLRLTVYLRPVNEPNPKPLSTTVHFFGGAAEAAGGYMCELPATETPATLGELIAHLGEENPALGRILEVSSFLVNERSARLDTELMPGVRVDVLPPFAGG